MMISLGKRDSSGNRFSDKSGPIKTKPIILDTGATDHVVVDPDTIGEISPLKEEVVSATQTTMVK
ncbi:MAG: hypothetical protein AAGM67_13265, partial [Bacteroidota bacterium]